MLELMVDFRNFAYAPKTIFEHRKFWSYCHYVIMITFLTVLETTLSYCDVNLMFTH